eukprot:TRINITY_DN2275_c0_g1_i3.p1 TRINITY_DN2275_c0_g1~~TRINITY_DN2275_c0_g1_i3.p1  ORF type:complete len:934 (-),score=292.68 TRINITY_DN2275_c0_g1_i3:894-3695(-)
MASKKLKAGLGAGMKKLKAAQASLTPPKLSAPKAGVSLANLKNSVVDTVTGTQVETVDTSSPIIESKCKELDQTAAFMETILKGMRKQAKQLKVYLESGQDLSDALQTFSDSCSDDLLHSTLEQIVKFESFYRAILVDMHKQSERNQEAISEWLQNNVPLAKHEKKEFEKFRRNLDQANLKLARAEQTADKEKANKEKLKELTTEQESKESAYLQQGEKSYNVIINTVENTKFNNVYQFNDYVAGYVNFFKHGHAQTLQFQEKLLELKNRAQNEQKDFQKSEATRPKNLWAPPAIGGDTNRVFAMNYQEVIDRVNPPDRILPFLAQSIKYLEEKALTTTGLFRVSPPKPALDAIRQKIDKGIPVDLDKEADEVHIVSGLIKLFLRELPQPLLTFELYKEWMEVLDAPTVREQVENIKPIVAALPEANRILLERLTYLCTRILEYEADNKMTVENIAIVLCPSILYDKDPNPLTMVQDIQKANGIMVIMILNYHELFLGKKPGEVQLIKRPRTVEPDASAAVPSGPPPPGTPPPAFNPPSSPPPSDLPPVAPTLTSTPSKNLDKSDKPDKKRSGLERSKAEKAASDTSERSEDSYSEKSTDKSEKSEKSTEQQDKPEKPTTTEKIDLKSSVGETTSAEPEKEKVTEKVPVEAEEKPKPIEKVPEKVPEPAKTIEVQPQTPTKEASTSLSSNFPSAPSMSDILKKPSDSPAKSHDGDAIEEDIEELVRGKIVVTLNPPPIPYQQLCTMIGEKSESTVNQYKQFFELFESSFLFARASHNLSTFSPEELNLLNFAFQSVGKAIKGMLSFIKEYTSKLPAEVAKRILSAANKVRPHIKDLISFIKSCNSGQQIELKGLTNATRKFLIATHQMFLTVYRASQMDELSQAALMCLPLLKNLIITLREGSNVALCSTILNNLQYYVLQVCRSPWCQSKSL